MQAIPQKVQSIRFDWMFSPRQDLLYFFLPVPLAYLMFMGAQTSHSSHSLLYAVILADMLGLGAFHQGATWFHFLDKSNREHYLAGAAGKLNFVVVPLCLFLATIAGEVFLAPLTFFIYVCWSLNHAVQQNIGVLLLYQNSKANEARISRNIQSWSQRWLALGFALVFFRRLLADGTPLAEMMWLPIAICIGAGICYCLAYLFKLAAEVSAGKCLNLPGFLFWLLCISYLIPFAFLGRNYDEALLIPLVVHWCQYIGINYVVAKRKYESGAGAELPVQRPVLLYVSAGLGLVAVLAALNYFQRAQGDTTAGGQVLKGMILGMGMIHYYLDGFIWRFRETFPREAMLPYLVRR